LLLIGTCENSEGSFEVTRLALGWRDHAGLIVSPGAVLLVKATTLKLKYLVRRRTFKLRFRKLVPSSHLWYGIEIPDDPSVPCTLWSVAEDEEELSSIAKIKNGEELHVCLFNEEDVHVASTIARMRFTEPGDEGQIEGVVIAPAEAWRQHENSIEELLSLGTRSSLVEAAPVQLCEWTETKATLVKRKLGRCELALISGEEGEQQEAVAEWLIDVLDAAVAVRNPIICEAKGERELSDLLLNHQYGCILVESKSLAVLNREVLPNRSTLSKNIVKHLKESDTSAGGWLCEYSPWADDQGYGRQRSTCNAGSADSLCSPDS
jgi:hypothetical protein